MKCERARELLGAHIDGELTPDDRAAVARHVTACPDCSAAQADFARLGRALRAEGRHPMPPGLEDKVRRSLDAAAVEADLSGKSVPPQRAPTRARIPTVLGRAAVLLLACLLSAAAAWWVADRTAETDRVEREIVNAHVRSLLQESPVQVASSDQHTVKPWFTGRTDFAPVVKDLAAAGFPLVGGRLDFVDGRRASALVYKRRLHIINVFMWPADSAGDGGPSISARNGYNILSLRRNRAAVWIVSDLNVDELRLLAGQL